MIRNPDMVPYARFARVSDVIESLVGCTDPYLCTHLERRAIAMAIGKDRDATYHDRRMLFETANMIQNWVRTVKPGGVALAGVYYKWAMEEGYPQDHMSVMSPGWRAIRNQWCRDYAAFLREFGL